MHGPVVTRPSPRPGFSAQDPSSLRLPAYLISRQACWRDPPSPTWGDEGAGDQTTQLSSPLSTPCPTDMDQKASPTLVPRIQLFPTIGQQASNWGTKKTVLPPSSPARPLPVKSDHSIFNQKNNECLRQPLRILERWVASSLNLCKQRGAGCGCEPVDAEVALSHFSQACLEPGWKAGPEHRTGA